MTTARASVHIVPTCEDELRELEGAIGPDALPTLNQCRTLDSVFVPYSQRNRGIGAGLVRSECRRADNMGWWLIAHAYPWEVFEDIEGNRRPRETLETDFDTMRDRLTRFYERLGFVHIGQGWCYRRPMKKLYYAKWYDSGLRTTDNVSFEAKDVEAAVRMANKIDKEVDRARSARTIQHSGMVVHSRP